MFRTFLTGTAALALITGATAQQKQQMTVNKVTTTPQFAGTYHPSTGLVTPGTGSGTAKLGPESIWNNNTLTGYYSVPGADQEWIDEGVLLDRNHNSVDQINGFDYTYCSAQPDPNGNGISSLMTFYDETTYCAGPASWPNPNCAYQIVGLPGGDQNGNLQCWIVTVDLCGFECNMTTDPAQNRLFGWGQVWDNSATGPWLASGGNGNTNTFVWFDTLAPNANAAFLGCYWFNGTPFAGFAGQLLGNPAETISYVSANGAGADDSLCLSADVSSQVGNTVTFTVSDANGATASTFWAAANAVDQDLSGAFGIDAHLLADYNGRRYTSTSATGDHVVQIPAAAGGGMTWYAQGATGSGGIPTAMSNGLQLYIF